MPHLLSGRWKILLFVFISLFISSACLTLPGLPAANSPAGFAFGPGSFNLPDTKAGLTDLSSYTVTLKYSFDGTRDGKTEKWTKTYAMLATKQPAARQLTVETTGNIPAVDTLFMAETGSIDYERLGQGSCTASVSSKNSPVEWPDPAGFLISVIGADKTGTETVNGVAADHYTFDERALGGQGFIKATGEMWVATHGGYIVRYLLLAQGDAGYLGKGIAGTLSWDYELTGANKSVEIKPPVDCPQGLVDAPQLPDASNIQSVPGSLTYHTASSLKDATAFYQKQIPGLGWKVLGDPAITDTTALLSFTQGTQELTVFITKATGGTNVDILLGTTPQ